MVKAAPSFGRIAAMVVFALSCFGLLLFLWLSFGGSVPLKPQGYRFHASFAEAGQLALQADVRISGVPVGKVQQITADKRTGRSDVLIQLDAKYAPLPSDAKAILRQKTLLGETYVELTPGHANARPVPDGGHLRTSQVSQTVELDEILRAFDPGTRRAFQEWMQTQAQAIGGHGQDLNDALGNLGPFADDTAGIVRILNREHGAVQRLVANTGVVFAALTERDGQLRSLIQNANRVFATTAARDRALQDSFRQLPSFEDQSRVTIDRLTRFANATNPLVTQLRPAARELSPTLKDVQAISPDLKALFDELPRLVAVARTGFPAAQRVLRQARPLIGELYPTSQQLTPMLDFIGLYKRELTSFFANTPSATEAKDPGTQLHYLRTTNPFNPENLAVYPKRIGSNRPNPYRLPGTFTELPRGLAVYEDRHCNRGVPTITNLPVTTPPISTPPTTLPGGITIPGITVPQFNLTPAQAQALIPDELLQRIQQYAFGNATNGSGVAAPPCRKQGPFHFGGEITQYPHVRKGR